MQRSSALRDLMLGLTLVLLSVYLLVLVRAHWIGSEVASAVVILAGMVAFSAISALQRFVEVPEPELVRIWIDEDLIREVLRSSEPTAPETAKRRHPEMEAPWDLDLMLLLVMDSSLAMAKVRLDIERELRRIAFETESVDIRQRPWSVDQLAHELVAGQYLPASVESVLPDVLLALNAAVHGAKIDKKLALRAVRAGSEIISFLKEISGERRK